MAMKIAIATKKQDRKLSLFFEASEIMCLAELLKQKQNLRSISIYGEALSTPPACGCTWVIHEGPVAEERYTLRWLVVVCADTFKCAMQAPNVI